MLEQIGAVTVHRSDQSGKTSLLLYNSLGSISVQCHSPGEPLGIDYRAH
jgi:hypothetical protein